MATDIFNYGRALQTLAQALSAAGGELDHEDLKRMSADDLVKMMANNDIRFVYDPQGQI